MRPNRELPMDDQDRFEACLPHTLAQECPYPERWSDHRNFSHDAHDRGGATMCGITQREYDVWRKSHALPVQDVRLMKEDEGTEIYQRSYWFPECPRLPAGLDLCVFDEAVSAGPHAAIKLLQASLGITSDGMWGPQTDTAVRAITHPAAVIGAFTAHREAYYRRLSTFRYFGRDWIRRSREIMAAALKMAPA